MKEMINSIKEKENRRADGDGAGLARSNSNNERDLQIWRRKLDDLKSKSIKKEEHLRAISDKYKELSNVQKVS